MEFIGFATKAVRKDKIECVTLYRNEVTIHTEHNQYTTCYNTSEIAERAYKELLEVLTKKG